MMSFVDLVVTVIDLYIWVLIAAAIFSWLINFNVLDMRNRLVATLADFLYRVTEPALRPIQRVVPLLGGVDISPVVLILLLFFVKKLIFEYIY
ncbi:MAG: YggT family protein [Rhodospirillales bacterium]|nr:YggT family protein [Rhodospirillales bacterium]